MTSELQRNMHLALQSDNPTKRLMAEAVFRDEFERFKAKLKSTGYTHLHVGVPPGWNKGPTNCFSAWPSYTKRLPKRRARLEYRGSNCIGDIIDREFPLFEYGCGNYDREKWGDQVQVWCTIPQEIFGTYEL